jgi:hypothetical protein
MHNLGQFDEWVSAARNDGPPSVDVAAKVVRTIERIPPRATVERPAIAIAATALIAASVAMVIAWQSWRIVHDPLVQWFKPPNYLTMQ